MGFDMSSVNSTLNTALSRVGGDIRSKLSAAQGKDLDETQLLDLQMQTNSWSMMVNLQSNIMKTMSEALKNTVSNVR